MKNKVNIFRKTRLLFSFLIASLIFGCTLRDELPKANSKVDTVPPEANFSYASAIEDFRTIIFTNLSNEATTFSWDFGGGNTSTDQDPTFTFVDGEGTYSVSLTASDALGATNTKTIEVLVVEGPFQPIILEPGFEDNTLPGGGGDGRDSWRNNNLGGVIQITGSPVTFGDQGAKLPVPAADRIGYQEITVEPETNYDLRFWYTMLSGSSDPSLTVAILGVTEFGPFENPQEAADGVIASVTVTNDEEPDVYIQQSLAFNSGINNTVAIYFYNGEVEARLDDFTIDVGAEGAVPPSVGFTSAQSETNYLEYTFDNSSTNASSYLWDFGDGNTSTDESPTHVYDTHDIYTVTLTATNDANLSNSLSKTINIQAPVTADFTYAVDDANYKTYHFMDASIDAVMLLWEFGDGYQFTGMNPTHTYAEDGTYTVTLTAYSVTGNMDVTTADITVAEGFVPIINEAGFEDNTLPGGGGDGRDSWENSDLGGVIQITGSPVLFGSQAAKLPSDGSRIGYQRITVEANTDYTVSFYYTMKDDAAGTLTVSILDDTVLTDPSGVAAATITSTTLNDQTDPNTYVMETLTFNSGSNTEIAIYFTNADVECRVDEFTID